MDLWSWACVLEGKVTEFMAWITRIKITTQYFGWHLFHHSVINFVVTFYWLLHSYIIFWDVKLHGEIFGAGISLGTTLGAKFNEVWFTYEAILCYFCQPHVLAQDMHTHSFKCNSRTLHAYTSDSAFTLLAWYRFANVSATNRGNTKVASAYIWK